MWHNERYQHGHNGTRNSKKPLPWIDWADARQERAIAKLLGKRYPKLYARDVWRKLTHFERKKIKLRLSGEIGEGLTLEDVIEDRAAFSRIEDVENGTRVLDVLTDNQKEIAMLLAYGFKQNEIAKMKGVHKGTIANTVFNMKKAIIKAGIEVY